MKRAFTLLEVVISITLFMILLIFLYKTLDQTKHSNNKLSSHTENIKYKNELYDIFLEDILESRSKIEIKKDNDKNSLLRFESSNSYHNSFFNHITYLISSNDKLIRIESKDKFNFGETQIGFYDYAFIDILLEDIEYFEVNENSKKSNENYVFVVKQKDKERIIFNTYKFK